MAEGGHSGGDSGNSQTGAGGAHVGEGGAHAGDEASGPATGGGPGSDGEGDPEQGFPMATFAVLGCEPKSRRQRKEATIHACLGRNLYLVWGGARPSTVHEFRRRRPTCVRLTRGEGGRQESDLRAATQEDLVAVGAPAASDTSRLLCVEGMELKSFLVGGELGRLKMVIEAPMESVQPPRCGLVETWTTAAVALVTPWREMLDAGRRLHKQDEVQWLDSSVKGILDQMTPGLRPPAQAEEGRGSRLQRCLLRATSWVTVPSYAAAAGGAVAQLAIGVADQVIGVPVLELLQRLGLLAVSALAVRAMAGKSTYPISEHDFALCFEAVFQLLHLDDSSAIGPEAGALSPSSMAADIERVIADLRRLQRTYASAAGAASAPAAGADSQEGYPVVNVGAGTLSPTGAAGAAASDVPEQGRPSFTPPSPPAAFMPGTSTAQTSDLILRPVAVPLAFGLWDSRPTDSMKLTPPPVFRSPVFKSILRSFTPRQARGLAYYLLARSARHKRSIVAVSPTVAVVPSSVVGCPWVVAWHEWDHVEAQGFDDTSHAIEAFRSLHGRAAVLYNASTREPVDRTGYIRYIDECLEWVTAATAPPSLSSLCFRIRNSCSVMAWHVHDHTRVAVFQHPDDAAAAFTALGDGWAKVLFNTTTNGPVRRHGMQQYVAEAEEAAATPLHLTTATAFCVGWEDPDGGPPVVVAFHAGVEAIGAYSAVSGVKAKVLVAMPGKVRVLERGRGNLVTSLIDHIGNLFAE
ncbi:hypothetical protein I4F81_000410 [Pyropia yezoensis]|uniref:Uncharacterized protein n=1 Tax=Pyropia yezoensis TaxID=2788 RepID=A0ACC3BJ63_PYRYE|nr:hypothetical protein I4F81_000410 [Neopyropia yezoensis]